MSTPFDYSEGEYIVPVSDNMAMNSDGDLMMRMGNGMAMDLDSGDLHFVSGWDDEDED